MIVRAGEMFADETPYRPRNLGGIAKHLATCCVVELSFNARFPNGFQQSSRAQAGHIPRIFRNIETDTHMALSTKVINLLRSDP